MPHTRCIHNDRQEGLGEMDRDRKKGKKGEERGEGKGEGNE